MKGIEQGDTILGIKLTIQDQTGIAVRNLNVFLDQEMRGYEVEYYYGEEELNDRDKCSRDELVVFTVEEVRAMEAEAEAEEEAEEEAVY